ncbi:hypothetical protein PITCH_A610001 [uncultured Desulfobacterium sp.]|uniref:Sigma-54 factor interaction domain-containing protein n=1 Tax=uncultured Desulfobacterium sp. TaxID=201089 RepID=A0A445N177_9BACT|nr:hypothetical protein PITCH_A610001 [uncultured Desulfobacterium sp.]
MTPEADSEMAEGLSVSPRRHRLETTPTHSGQKNNNPTTTYWGHPHKCAMRHKKEYKIPGTVIDALYSYQWPGNVRELENVVQRYISLGYLDIPTASVRKVNTKVDFSSVIEQQNDNLYSTVESFEKEYLVAVLNENHWHRGKAAESLGIFPKTLYRKMKKYGLA